MSYNLIKTTKTRKCAEKKIPVKPAEQEVNARM